MLSFLKRKYINLTSDKKFSEILTGSTYAVAAQVAAIGLTMVTNVIVARVYGAEATGILALVNSFMILVTIFTVMGTGSSILRLIPEHLAKYSVTSAFHIYRKTQFFVAGISLASGTVFFFLAGIVADKIFSKPHLAYYFAIASIFVMSKAMMDLNTQSVRGLRLNRTFAIMRILPSMAMLTILLVVMVLPHDASIPVYAQMGAYTITAIIGILIMDRAFKKQMQSTDQISSASIRKILSVSLPMMMTASISFFIGQTGIIMLGMFQAESDVGYYSVAVKLATLTAFILQAVNTMAAPKFAELFHTDNLDELFYVAKKSTKLIFWTTTPILLTLIIFGRFILGTLFGNEFVIAYPAMVLLVVGQFVGSISGSTGYFLNMTGKQKVLRNIIMFAAIINISLNYLLVPRYGIVGAAFSGAVSLIFWNLYVIAYIKKEYGQTIGYLPFCL